MSATKTLLLNFSNFYTVDNKKLVNVELKF